jgi:ATP-dependent protease ClpP protease subunit
MGKKSSKQLINKYIMASEETKKEVSGISDAGLHLLMEEVSINTAQSAIEWILEANFKNTEKKHKELNLVICSPGGDLAAAFLYF